MIIFQPKSSLNNDQKEIISQKLGRKDPLNPLCYLDILFIDDLSLALVFIAF